MLFGKTSADFPEAGANDDEVWVRTFNKDSTFVRIAPVKAKADDGRELEGSEAWIKELEHYDRLGFGRSFPCPVPHGWAKDRCPGCSHDNEDVRKRSAKWFFNALDEKNYLRVYKIGVKLLRKFKLREQRLGTVSDRDYEVIRSGKEFNEIEYDLEGGEKSQRDFPETLHDIAEILSRSFEEAVDYYKNGPKKKDEENDSEEDAPKHDTKLADKLEAERAERKATETKAVEPKDAEKPEDVPSPEWAAWGKNPTSEQIGDAETSDIKAWLEEQKVEFPARAPRSRIIAMAKEQAAKAPF